MFKLRKSPKGHCRKKSTLNPHYIYAFLIDLLKYSSCVYNSGCKRGWIRLLYREKSSECFSYIYYHTEVLADLRNAYYKKSSVRSNVLPVSDLDVLDGRFTRVKCSSLCREATSCQTFFYKSDDKQCSLYNYPLLENTPVYANTGVAVYETIGKLPKCYI